MYTRAHVYACVVFEFPPHTLPVANAGGVGVFYVFRDRFRAPLDKFLVFDWKLSRCVDSRCLLEDFSSSRFLRKLLPSCNQVILVRLKRKEIRRSRISALFSDLCVCVCSRERTQAREHMLKDRFTVTHTLSL